MRIDLISDQHMKWFVKVFEDISQSGSVVMISDI